MQGPIGRILQKVEDDKSDGIHDLMGAHCRITAHNRRGYDGRGGSNSIEMV